MSYHSELVFLMNFDVYVRVISSFKLLYTVLNLYFLANLGDIYYTAKNAQVVPS